jgi:hypothetical protein
MTKEQIDSLSPEEKRQRIGLLCGAKEWPYSMNSEQKVVSFTKPTEKEEIWLWGRDLGSLLPDYLNSADAAVQLCNFAASKGWNCEMNQGLNACWECIFKRRTTERTETTREAYGGGLWEEHYFPADTLPEAICGAFLMLPA